MATPTVKLVEDEFIYIDCNPVDSIGNEVEVQIEEEQDTDTYDNPSDVFDFTNINNNLGFQFTIAITFFGIIYGLGNYIFKTVPNDMLEKRLNNF